MTDIQQVDRECAADACRLKGYIVAAGCILSHKPENTSQVIAVDAARLARERMEREVVQPLRDELAETETIAERDGYEKAVQDIDCLTGGDGEYRGSTIAGRTVDCATMKQRIAERFEAASEREKALTEREAQIQALVAKLYCASGCSCCRDDDVWEASSSALATLFGVPTYADNSGFNWYLFRDDQALAGGSDDVR